MLTLLHDMNDFTLMVLQGYGLHATITGHYTMLLLGVPLTWILLSMPPCLNSTCHHYRRLHNGQSPYPGYLVCDYTKDTMLRATITGYYTVCHYMYTWTLFCVLPYLGTTQCATVPGYYSVCHHSWIILYVLPYLGTLPCTPLHLNTIQCATIQV